MEQALKRAISRFYWQGVLEAILAEYGESIDSIAEARAKEVMAAGEKVAAIYLLNLWAKGV